MRLSLDDAPVSQVQAGSIPARLNVVRIHTVSPISHHRPPVTGPFSGN